MSWNRRVKAHPNPVYTDTWQEIRASMLNRLIVDPERAAWILQTYPPTDLGRPGVLNNEQRSQVVQIMDFSGFVQKMDFCD
jgi:hypothetical protein